MIGQERWTGCVFEEAGDSWHPERIALAESEDSVDAADLTLRASLPVMLEASLCKVTVATRCCLASRVGLYEVQAAECAASCVPRPHHSR